MAVPRYLMLGKGRSHRFYYYETFSSYRDAYNTARYFKHNYHTNYYIMITESNWIGYKQYHLYFDRWVKPRLF